MASLSMVKGFVCLAFVVRPVGAFHVCVENKRATLLLNSHSGSANHRRQFLIGSALSSLFVGQAPAKADEDLTSQLFNPDGSLKDGISSEVAKTKVVEFTWDESDTSLVNVDGANAAGTVSGSQVRISYELPDKWGRKGDQVYIDTSEGVNAPACTRIVVYKAAGKASSDRLDKATTIGVGTALQVAGDLERLKAADTIGGRKLAKSDQKYYAFDMALAPDKCENKGKDDLGLGFCPYDTVFLISATILHDGLYVMAIECDNLEWKQGNSDLKRVRSSFSVESIA